MGSVPVLKPAASKWGHTWLFELALDMLSRALLVPELELLLLPIVTVKEEALGDTTCLTKENWAG